jgi:hypothetical protein
VVAPDSEVGISARLQVLHRLLRADVPQGLTRDDLLPLAQSLAVPRGLDPQRLLDDLSTSATANTPFASLPSAQAFKAHEGAFIGEEVCRIENVTVAGRRAVSIYSEFETTAHFDSVARWVDPRSWPDRGPLLFKQMTPIAPETPARLSTLGADEQWHSIFREEVQLVTRVATLLDCAFWRDGNTAAGMTYEFAGSIDSQIDVDRGYLSVERVPGGRLRVRALKIVSFTDDIWDLVATFVCPLWTDWVRSAVEGGDKNTSTGSSPAGGARGPDSSIGDNLADWVDFLSDSARTYVDLLAGINGKAVSGGFTRADWINDGARYWSQVAKDWAKAWKYGLAALDEIAEQGLDAGLVPPGADPKRARGAATAAAAARSGARVPAGAVHAVVDVPLPAGTDSARVVCSDLRGIDAKGATIPAGGLFVTVAGEAESGKVARVATTNRVVPAGLYVGKLHTPAGAELARVLLYVSRAGDEAPA